MTQNENSGNDPRKTIDHNGNVVDKGYGLSRWSRPRNYACAHDDCDEQAIRVSTFNGTHNCCGSWHHEGGLD